MALSLQEIIRIRRDLEARRLAEDAREYQSRIPSEGTFNIPGGEERVEPRGRTPFARLGVGALSFLDQLQAGGGGGIRRFTQALTPGEQGLERELRRISEERGRTFNPWESFKRQGEASRLDPGREFKTPFGGATIKGFRYLPEQISYRGVAEVGADPLNLLFFAPFVGAPIRAAEMGLLGGAKGALSGTLGSVGKGLAIGGGERTLGGALKGIGMAAPRGATRAVTEGATGVARSIDLERRILGRSPWGGRARPSVRTDAEAQENLAKQLEDKARLDRDHGVHNPSWGPKETGDIIEREAVKATGLPENPTLIERFKNSRIGTPLVGKEAPGFRETFGRSRMGVMFAERVGGLKGLLKVQGEGLKRTVAKVLHIHHVDVTSGVQGNGLKAGAMMRRERVLAETNGLAQNKQKFYTHLVRDKKGNPVKWEDLAPDEKLETFSTRIMERVGDLLDRSKGISHRLGWKYGEIPRGADGGLTFDLVPTGGSKRRYKIVLSKDEVDVLEDMHRYLNSAFQDGFYHTVKRMVARGFVEDKAYAKKLGLPTDRVPIKPDTEAGLTAYDAAKDYIKGKGNVKGSYVPHNTRSLIDNEEIYEELTWTASRKRVGQALGIEKPRLEDYDTYTLARRALDNEIEMLASKPSEVMTYYGEQAVKLRAQDNMELALQEVYVREKMLEREAVGELADDFIEKKMLETTTSFFKGKGKKFVPPRPIEFVPSKRVMVISGGQMGADKLGLEAGKELGLKTGGTATRGFMATKELSPEDVIINPKTGDVAGFSDAANQARKKYLAIKLKPRPTGEVTTTTRTRKLPSGEKLTPGTKDRYVTETGVETGRVRPGDLERWKKERAQYSKDVKAAWYDPDTDTIYVDSEVLKRKFQDQVWADPDTYSAYISKTTGRSEVDALPANQFKNITEFEDFVTFHEWAHRSNISGYSRTPDGTLKFTYGTKGPVPASATKENAANQFALRQMTFQYKPGRKRVLTQDPELKKEYGLEQVTKAEVAAYEANAPNRVRIDPKTGKPRMIRPRAKRERVPGEEKWRVRKARPGEETGARLTQKEPQLWGQSAFYGARTELNVKNADITLIFTVEGGASSAGSKLTRDFADLHGKVYLNNPSASQVKKKVAEIRSDIASKLPAGKETEPLIVNIAGNREFKNKKAIRDAINAAVGDAPKPSEISSNAKGLNAALTNPTRLAKKKGNITQDYPVIVRGKKYPDAEAAYQDLKGTTPDPRREIPEWSPDEARYMPTESWMLGGEGMERYKLMVEVITAKLQQHKRLVEEIKARGGSPWILHNVHQPSKRYSLWHTNISDGFGGENWFIEALNQAFRDVTKTKTLTPVDFSGTPLKYARRLKTPEELEAARVRQKVSEFHEEVKKIMADAQLPLLEAEAQAFNEISPDAAKLLLRHFEIGSKAGVRGFTAKLNEEIFGPLRGLRAGIDFGFMGINTLPLLFADPKAYGTAWKNAIGSLKEWRYEKFIYDNLEDFMEMTRSGYSLSRYSSDIFEALNRGQGAAGALGVAGRTPFIGQPLESGVAWVQKPLERSFYASMDSARLSMYKFYKPLWENITDPYERAIVKDAMAEFANYSTGGFSAQAQGITPNQREIESGWMFFSPRYTRASMGLVAKVFSGEVGGVEARRMLNNALTVAIPMYIHVSRALGQEPNLDPTNGGFLTVKINDDQVGPATFFRQLATLVARITSDPESIAFMDDRPGITFSDRVFNHPIVRFFRGRTPISTGLAVDVAVGADFLGNELEAPMDWGKHVGGQALPFWAEGLAFADPYRAGVPAVVSEILGTRAFPASPYNRRMEMRDSLAMGEFGMKWNVLTDNEKQFIENSNVELAVLDEEVRVLRQGRDQGFDRLLEEKKRAEEQLNENWERAVIPLLEDYVDAVNGGNFTLREITQAVKEANRVRRDARAALKTDPKYAEVDRYYDERRANGDIVNQHADDLVEVFYHDVMEATENGDGTVNYKAREEAERRFFALNPGMEQYIDTQNYLGSVLNDQHPLLAEYFQMQQDFRYYWEGSEYAVFNAMPHFEVIRPLYDEWADADDSMKDYIEQQNPLLSELLSMLRKVRLAMRRRDMILDRALVRWGIGGITTPQHQANKDLYDEDRKKGGKSRFADWDYDIRRQDLT